jgi:sec-independent protein translocase protein TatA
MLLFPILFITSSFTTKRKTMGDLFSGPHMILIVLVVLLMFGGKKIPELMRGLGRGIREFKDAKDNVRREFEDHMHDEPAPKSNAPAAPTKQISTDSSVN